MRRVAGFVVANAGVSLAALGMGNLSHAARKMLGVEFTDATIVQQDIRVTDPTPIRGLAIDAAVAAGAAALFLSQNSFFRSLGRAGRVGLGAFLVAQTVGHALYDETIVGRIAVFPDQAIVVTSISIWDYLHGHRVETHADIHMPFGNGNRIDIKTQNS